MAMYLLDIAMPAAKKARAVGMNHLAYREALAFYGQLFDFELRGASETLAFRPG